MSLTIQLRKGEKSLQKKFPIALNGVLDLFWKIISYLQHKGKLFVLQVQTAHFGIGVNAKQAGTSFGKNTYQKLNCIDNNPLASIADILTIYWKVIPSIIDVGPITPLEIFNTLCTCTAVGKFNNILFKASRKTFEFIQASFNKKTCLIDEISDKVKAWGKKSKSGICKGKVT